MKTEMTRQKLRMMIDTELIGEISRLPIEPMQMGKYLLHREGAWRMLVTETILPFCRYQIRMLKRHEYLLNDDEKNTVSFYEGTIAAYATDWRSHPFMFPPQPTDFVNILKS